MNKILAIDAGNSFVKYGLFGDGVLEQTWRHETGKTAESCAAVLQAAPDATVALSSVVPAASETIKAACSGRTVIEINAAAQSVLTGVDATMGGDLVAQAVAAWKLHANGKAVVVLGFGTASTLLAISAAGQVLGGWIAPGVAATLEVLHERCALLPLLKMESQSEKLGWDTDSFMRNGVYLAHVGLAKQWLESARKSAPGSVSVATGGWAETIGAHSTVFDIVDKNLTLQGIYLIASAKVVPAAEADTKSGATAVPADPAPTQETAGLSGETKNG